MKDFDPKKESKFIIYLDTNRLYGWAVSETLPTHGFQRMKDSELTNEEVIRLLE